MYYQQEGWLSPTERASVSASSLMPRLDQRNMLRWCKRGLRNIIWLHNESHAGMSLPTAVRRVQDLAPGTIAVYVTWIENEFNACQTHRSMYPSIFNRFPVTQHVSSNVRHFSSFFCTFWHPLVTPLGKSPQMSHG